MRLTLTKDMAAARAAAKAAADAVLTDSVKALIHARKRQEAETVAAGGTSDLLSAEAALRGIAVTDLAALILSKPDDLMALELRRQEKRAAIKRATCPAEIKQAIEG